MKRYITLLVWFLVARFGDSAGRDESFRMNAKRCEDLAKDPYFDIEQVVAHTWRVYYTWYMNLDAKCLDLNFRNATPNKVNRIHQDMYEYLEAQPNWNAATLFLTVGAEKHEMLLFADQGPAGGFTGVPNVVRDSGYPGLKPIPPLKFFLKLINNGKFLVTVDCNFGYSTLSTGSGTPYRSEVLTVVNALPFPDEGYMACTSEKRKDEIAEFV